MLHNSSKAISIVLSSPSAGGKSTIAKSLLQHDTRLHMSISYTSRAQRKNEIDGADYFFIHETEFINMIKEGEILEYSKIYGNLYGTSKTFVTEKLQNNQDILFDLDHHGALAIKEHTKKQSVSIFIMPPSLDILRARIIQRDRDSLHDIEMRMNSAKEEISYAKYYDYTVINNDLDQAVKDIQDIIDNERKKLNNGKKT